MIESFRFEDKSEYEYDIYLTFFACFLLFYNKDTQESFILLFFNTKVSMVIFTEGGLSLSQWQKLMIKLLTFDNLFPPLSHSH